MAFKHLWQLLRKKDEIPSIKQIRPIKTEEERLIELEERRNEAELNRLKIAEIKRARLNKEIEDLGKNIEYDGEYEETEEEDGDLNQILGLLTPIMSSVGKSLSNGENPPTPQNSMASQPTQDISDEEIRGFLRQQKPTQLKLAKAIPKPLLFRKIKEQMPLSDAECEKAYQILVTEF